MIVLFVFLSVAAVALLLVAEGMRLNAAPACATALYGGFVATATVAIVAIWALGAFPVLVAVVATMLLAALTVYVLWRLIELTCSDIRYLSDFW